MKIRGSKPTRDQRKILEKNNMNPADWLYTGPRVVEGVAVSSRSLRRYSVKTTYLIFVNRETGEEKLLSQY